MSVVLSLMFNDHESAGHVEHTCYDPSSTPSSAGNRESIKICSISFKHIILYLQCISKELSIQLKNGPFYFLFDCILKTLKSTFKWTL